METQEKETFGHMGPGVVEHNKHIDLIQTIVLLLIEKDGRRD